MCSVVYSWDNDDIWWLFLICTVVVLCELSTAPLIPRWFIVCNCVLQKPHQWMGTYPRLSSRFYLSATFTVASLRYGSNGPWWGGEGEAFWVNQTHSSHWFFQNRMPHNYIFLGWSDDRCDLFKSLRQWLFSMGEVTLKWGLKESKGRCIYSKHFGRLPRSFLESLASTVEWPL